MMEEEKTVLETACVLVCWTESGPLQSRSGGINNITAVYVDVIESSSTCAVDMFYQPC